MCHSKAERHLKPRAPKRDECCWQPKPAPFQAIYALAAAAVSSQRADKKLSTYCYSHHSHSSCCNQCSHSLRNLRTLGCCSHSSHTLDSSSCCSPGSNFDWSLQHNMPKVRAAGDLSALRQAPHLPAAWHCKLTSTSASSSSGKSSPAPPLLLLLVLLL